ncbi:MAG: GAF domain-containing protein, partial [Bacteroidota bacterium]
FDDVKERMERVDELMNYVQTHRNNITKGTKAFLLVPDDKFLKPYEAAGKQFAAHFDTLQLLLETQGFTDLEKLTEAKASIKEYYGLMGEIISLKRQGSDSTALAIYQTDPGFPVWEVCYEFANQVQAFEDELYAEARNRYQYHLYVTTVMQALLFLIGVPTLIFAIRQIRKSNNLRRQLFTNLLESRKTFLVDDRSDDSQQSEQDSVEYIINDLKTASKFINRIADGDYSVTWEDVKSDEQTSNQDNLAEALANMREQMKAVKQKDQQQLWMTEGEGKVAEIARTHQTDLTALGDELLSYIVKYLKANQAGLFIINETDSSEQYLEMVACYAYDKKKHEEKQIRVGQGLLGQAFLEQKVIRLNQIPDNYVSITSGLGEATPSYLAIIPLKFNEEVLGVLEIASFQDLSDFEIDFLEKVSEIVASSISVVRTSQRTKVLLEESRQQAEEMQAQEEEMRQNMEEMQATQEQYQRLQQELQENEKVLQIKLAELEEANLNSKKIRQEEKQRAEDQISARTKMMEKAIQKFKKREEELVAQLEATKK